MRNLWFTAIAVPAITLSAINLQADSRRAIANSAGGAGSHSGSGRFALAREPVARLEAPKAGELKRAFGLAVLQPSAAIEIGCWPASAGWCATGFHDVCAKNGGGLNSDPDGGITCSIPD